MANALTTLNALRAALAKPEVVGSLTPSVQADLDRLFNELEQAVKTEDQAKLFVQLDLFLRFLAISTPLLKGLLE